MLLNTGNEEISNMESETLPPPSPDDSRIMLPIIDSSTRPSSVNNGISLINTDSNLNNENMQNLQVN